jgi:hypothetical protein
MTQYVPVTPAGTICAWLMSETEDEAWKQLMKEAAHMPYRNKQEFIDRGYEVCPCEDQKDDSGT